jgi:hypothetical protein
MTPSDQVLGNLKEQSFEQIWNSTKLKKMRTNMREGRACKECSRCYEMEKSGMPTTRTWANNWFSNHFDKVESTKVDGTVDKVNIPYIDFRFSNICNFKCRTGMTIKRNYMVQVLLKEKLLDLIKMKKCFGKRLSRIWMD